MYDENAFYKAVLFLLAFALALAGGLTLGYAIGTTELAATEARLSVCGEGWYQTMGALKGMLVRFSDVAWYEDGSYSGCVPDSLCAQ